MEATQFYSRSVSPLVTRSFACKWSEDNRLSVLTERGVHVIEVLPSARQASPLLNLSRSFIHSPETLPAEHLEQDLLGRCFDWPKQDVYSFLMQDALTPSFPKALPASPEIRDVFWSPRNLLHPLQCLLALVTSAGALELAVQLDRNWISIYQFTPAWTSLLHQDTADLRSSDNLDGDSLKEHLYRLIVTTATWSTLYQEPTGSCFAYLVTAHASSEILIWKVEQVTSDSINLDFSMKNVALKFKKKLSATQTTKISTLLWVHLSDKNYLLIVGYFNGQVAVLKLQAFEGGITSGSHAISYSDQDNIPVEYLHVLRQTDKWLEIVVIKGMYLVVLVIDIHGKMISMKYISSPGFSITGASVIDPNMILITAQDGNFCMVKKSHDQQELLCTPIKLDILKNHAQYLGLASSSNKVLFTLVTSPSIIYDHLIDREPSSVYFLNLLNVPSLDPLYILYKNKQESLINCWDCLELIKINASKHNNLPQILTQVSVDLESLSLYKLQIAFWIMTISETLRKKNIFEESLKPPEEIELSKSYIFLHSAVNHLSHLALRENLTEVQKLCMTLLRNHLDIWLAGEEEEVETPLSENVKQILEATSKLNLTEQEKCNFCGVIITEPWAVSCSSGHKLPRCALTCLQVTCIKYRTCIVCQEIFHPCLDTEFNEVRCLYCDLPALYRNQLPDYLLQSSKKNLSRKCAIAANNKDPKEEEM